MKKDFLRKLIFLAGMAIFLIISGQASAVTVYTTDFINDATRTNFNGFEGLPDTGYYNPPYTEDGIIVQQINGYPFGIWTTYNYWGAEGSRSWYPNGGDYGHTSITKEDGANFNDVGFLRGSGQSGLFLYYELRLDGALIQSGTLEHQTNAQYLGFSGGGFDEILLRDSSVWINSLTGGYNGLAIDSIELSDSYPHPRTYHYAPSWLRSSWPFWDQKDIYKISISIISFS